MKIHCLAMIFFASNVFAAEGNSFNFFSGSYHVAKRTCNAQDLICASVDTIQVVYKPDAPTEVLELKKGKILDRTKLLVYGNSSDKTSYGMIYGTSNTAIWRESIKNTSAQVTEENTAGIRQEPNTNPDGPIYIYSFGKAHKTYDPTTGKTLSQSLRSYHLLRDETETF